MTGDEVLLETADQVARITLNRPAILNAQNMAWVNGLDTALSAVAEDPAIRVVTVRGAGTSFCAGLDLDMLSSEGMPADFYAVQERAFARLEDMGKLTVALIHGYCLGGGVQLAIACDVRIASADARLGLPALHEALFPGMAVFRLPRLIGLGPARRLILSAELLDAHAAFDIGLVDHLVPAEEFDPHVGWLINAYRLAPPTATVAAKRLMAKAFTATREQVYEESKPLLRACLDSPEAKAAAASWRRRGRATNT